MTATPPRTRRDGLRALRIGLTLLNALCAVITVAVGAVLVSEMRAQADPARPGHKATLRAFELPRPAGIGEAPLELTFRGTDAAPPPVWPSVYEDAQVLRDAVDEFSHQWRVVFAGLEGDPAARTCILQSRTHGQEDQLALKPGERVGAWLLMRIDPQPGAPRSVVLGFRELARGEDFQVVIKADP